MNTQHRRQSKRIAGFSSRPLPLTSGCGCSSAAGGPGCGSGSGACHGSGSESACSRRRSRRRSHRRSRRHSRRRSLQPTHAYRGRAQQLFLIEPHSGCPGRACPQIAGTAPTSRVQARPLRSATLLAQPALSRSPPPRPPPPVGRRRPRMANCTAISCPASTERSSPYFASSASRRSSNCRGQGSGRETWRNEGGRSGTLCG